MDNYNLDRVGIGDKPNMGNKGIPVVFGVLLVLLILLLVYSPILRSLFGDTDLGNPYNCNTCKTIGMACKDHRGFDYRAELEEKITMVVTRYNTEFNSTTDEYYLMYGEFKYNTECDFCISVKEECYACNFDRQFIVGSVRDIVKSRDFNGRVCKNCYNSGALKCSFCRQLLLDMAIRKLLGTGNI